MGSWQRHNAVVAILAGSFALFLCGRTAGAEPGELAESVQGTWERQQATPAGRILVVKVHKGHTTFLTAYDEQKNVIYSHQSEFRIEKSGRVLIFTFFERTITAGPNAGQTIKDPVSFVCRVTGNRFIEVHGVLDDDASAPLMIIWDRKQGETKGDKAA